MLASGVLRGLLDLCSEENPMAGFILPTALPVCFTAASLFCRNNFAHGVMHPRLFAFKKVYLLFSSVLPPSHCYRCWAQLSFGV